MTLSFANLDLVKFAADVVKDLSPPPPIAASI